MSQQAVSVTRRQFVKNAIKASTLFAAAKHPKSFVSLDDADHLLSRARDSRYAGAGRGL